MNRHFEDTLYYLKRAGETARRGVSEEVAPIERKVREVTGREEEPEPGRLDEIKAELEAAREKAEGEAKEAIENAREAIDEYRATRIASE